MPVPEFKTRAIVAFLEVALLSVVACAPNAGPTPSARAESGNPPSTPLVASGLPILVEQITHSRVVEAWRIRIDEAGWIPVLALWHDSKTAKVRPTTVPALAVRPELKLWDDDLVPNPTRSFLPNSSLGFTRTLDSYTQETGIRRLRDRWAMDPYPVSPAGEYTVSRGIAQDFAALKFKSDDLAMIDPVPGITDYWRLLGPGNAERVYPEDLVDH